MVGAQIGRLGRRRVVREERLHRRAAGRRAGADASRNALGLSARALELPMPSPRHRMRAAGTSCLAREVVSERASSAREAGFTRTVLDSAAAATPLSVIRSLWRVTEDRRLCVTVFRRFCPCSTRAVWPPARDVTYRAGPHRRAGGFRQGVRAEDSGTTGKQMMRRPGRVTRFAHSGSVKPCWRTSRVQAATRCRS